MAIVAALFIHPVFSFVGFWLICTGLLLTLGSALGTVIGLDMNSPPTWFFVSAMSISGVLAVLLRKIVPKMMKWTFYVLLGGLVLAFVGGVISALIERSTSG
jgi:drug/metabolite transporter (DMT)-like permease